MKINKCVRCKKEPVKTPYYDTGRFYYSCQTPECHFTFEDEEPAIERWNELNPDIAEPPAPYDPTAPLNFATALLRMKEKQTQEYGYIFKSKVSDRYVELADNRIYTWFNAKSYDTANRNKKAVYGFDDECFSLAEIEGEWQEVTE